MKLCLPGRLTRSHLWLSAVLLTLFMMYGFHQSRPRRDFSTAVNVRLKFSTNLEETLGQPGAFPLQPGRHRLQRYHRSKRLNRYILSLNYWEQFSMATVNLFNLVCLGELWNATTVQPFTFNSRLYGLRNLKPDDNFNRTEEAHLLDIIYNITSFNQVLEINRFKSLSTFDNFLRYSSRNVVVVHYISPRETRELPVMKGKVGDAIQAEFAKDYIVNCQEHLRDYLQMLEDSMNDEANSDSKVDSSSGGDYRIIKYWCVNMTYSSTPQESAMKMGIDAEDDVTIVVVNWRGLGTKRVIKGSVKGKHNNNRVAMFNSCKNYSFKNWRNLVTYSPGVSLAAKYFRQGLALKESDSYAVVHIRSEKLGLREPRMPGVTATCFQELERVTSTFAKKHPKVKFIYVTDYGPFSSDTCKKCRGSKDVRRFLNRRRIIPRYFNPSHYNMINDTGLAAAAESQFMSSANYLFLCGGGAYQNQIATRFQKQKRHRFGGSAGHGKKRIFSICNDDGDILALLKKKII